MNKLIKNSTCFLFLLLFSWTAYAQKMHYRIPDQSMVFGDTITVPIYADSTFTGKEVRSFSMKVTYSTSYFEVLGVESDGTISGQGSVSAHVKENGYLFIAGAKGGLYEGDGEFCRIKVRALQSRGSSISISSNFSDTYFNEGGSTVTVESGYISVAAPPSISLSPSYSTMLIGDSVQLSVYGDKTGPVSYTVEDQTVGRVSESGKFFALKPGNTRIIAVDSVGTTVRSGNFKVLGYRLSTANDLRAYPGDTISVPVYTTDISGQGVMSGSFSLAYSTSVLDFVGVNASDCMLEGSSTHASVRDSRVYTAFATTQPLEGKGTLLNLEFVVLSSSSTSLGFYDLLFNESLGGLSVSGYFRGNSFSTIYLSPNGTIMYSGDKLKLTASNGIAPFRYSVDNEEIASVNDNGILTAIQGGKVRVSVEDSVGACTTSNYFTIYDTKIEIPDTTGPVNEIYDLPVFVDDIPDHLGVRSLQMELTYDSLELRFVEVVQKETLTEGWSFFKSMNDSKLKLAAAGTSSFNEKGVLFYLRFHLKDEMSLNETEYISVDNCFFNEGSPSLKTENGSIRAVKSKDLGISHITSPMSDCEHSSLEYVQATIANYGYVDYEIGDTILSSVRLDYGTTYTDTIVLKEVLKSGESMEYRYSQPFDLSAIKRYRVECRTLLSSTYDGNTSNNYKSVRVDTYGKLDIDLGEDIAVAIGDTFSIAFTSQFDSCVWSQGDANVNEISYVLKSLETDTIWVKAYNAYGCESVDTVIVRARPSVKVTSDEYDICVGEFAIFRATASAAGNNPTYAWLLNGEVLDDETADTLALSSLVSSDEIQCMLSFDSISIADEVYTKISSDIISIVVIPNLMPNVVISINPNMMENDSILGFIAKASNAGASPRYNWMINGTAIGVTTDTATFSDLQQGVEVSCEITMSSEVECYTILKDTSNIVLADYNRTAPEVAFSANKQTGVDSLIVSFANSSMGTYPSYEWNFGDGTTSTEANPVHQYSTVGTFDVTLTASNAYGIDVVTKEDYITITSSTAIVTFLSWDNTLLKVDTVKIGEDATAPVAPERDGYYFTGWSEGITNVTTDYSVVAQYEEIRYVVTYADWDGSVLQSDTVLPNTWVNAPFGSLERDGFSFEGWGTYSYKAISDTVFTAQYDILRYEVIFRNSDWTVLKTDTVDHGSAVVPPAVPEREGYTFTGWDLQGSEKATNLDSVISYIVAFAEFEKAQYAVTFADWDSTVIKVDSVEYQQHATAPQYPARDGHTFTGWGVSYNNVKSDLMVIAQYSVNSYQVSFVDWDASSLKVDDVDYGTAATAPSNPEREGYTFTGWDAAYDSIIADVTITAEYEINTYTITFQDWDSTVLFTDSVDYGGSATAPTNPERENYTFTGWDVEFSNISSDLTVTAQYSINSFVVIFADWNGLILKEEEVNFGSEATAPTNPERDGYTFTGWDVAYDSIVAEVTITAEYVINTYAVTFQDWDGTVLVTDSVEYGNAATVPAAPEREHYTFTGWDVDFTVVTNDVTVTAQYSIHRYLVIFSDWDGFILKEEEVGFGSAAIAPSNPEREGYTFTGWDAAYDSIIADVTITAQYAINRYDVNFKDWDGVLLKSETVEHGSSATAPSDPSRAGYWFIGWDVAFDNVRSAITVTAQYKQAKYVVSFNITDGGSPIVGAELAFQGLAAQTSDAAGQVVLSDSLTIGTYSYSITADGYAPVDSTIALASDTLISIEMNAVSGLRDYQLTTLELYPNPATTSVIITGVAGEEIVVYDLSGNEVLRHLAISENEKLNISSLKQGVYFVKAETAICKLVVE